jgi:hypothetical protein
MQPIDLLRCVLPETKEGEKYVFVTMKSSLLESNNSSPLHKWKDNPKEILDIAKVITERAIDAGKIADHHNAYFGMATFDSSKGLSEYKGRTQANAKRVRSLFIDIDVGKKGSSYDTAAQVTDALDKFLHDTDLPKPIVIRTGKAGGIHAYWPFSEAIAITDWKVLAEDFEKLCIQHNLKIDTSVTTDCSRILRVPNTYNFNSGFGTDATEVVFSDPTLDINDVTINTFKWYRDKIPSSAPIENDPKPTHDIKNSKYKYSVKKLRELGKEGMGCNQIENAYENQENVSYLLWRALLSILIRCEDGVNAIHEASKKHPKYDSGATEGKAKDTKVHKCETFHKINPSACESCLHKDSNIGTPLTLARDGLQDEARNIGNGSVNLLPNPYFTDGEGIYVEKMVKGKKTPAVVKVYHRPFYVVERRRDPEEGDLIVARLEPRKDEHFEFDIPGSFINTPTQLKSLLGSHGILLRPDEVSEMINYLIEWNTHLADKERATQIKTQFGWDTLDTDEIPNSFGWGDKLYLRGGKVVNNPIRRNMERYLRVFRKKGTVKKWSEGVKELYSVEGEEARQFCLGVSLATPMFRDVAGVSGAVISLYSRGSGRMKSATMRILASIWGDSDESEVTGETSAVSILKRNSIYKSIPVIVDETTNKDGQAVSRLAYGVSGGKEKDRLKQTGQELWSNDDRWKLTTFISTNEATEKALVTKRKAAQGELARIFELTLPKNDSSDSVNSTRVGNILANHGNAGIEFIKWILKDDKNREKCLKIMKFLESKIGDKVEDMVRNTSFSNSSRYYTALGRIGLTGLIIGKDELGLWDFDYNKVFDWYINQLAEMFNAPTNTRESCSEILSRLIAENYYNHALVINSDVDLRKNNEDKSNKCTHEPRGALYIRYEPDENTYYINGTFLSGWITENASITLTEFKNGIGDILVSANAKKNMLRGYMPEEGDEYFSKLDADVGKAKKALNEVRCWVFRTDGALHED